MERYKIDKIDLGAAEHVWNFSEQKSLWNRPFLLNEIAEIQIWGVFKGSEPVAIWPISSTGRRIPFSYYIGPLISKKRQSNEKDEPNWNLRIVISTFLDEIVNYYKHLEFSVSNDFDLRPFIWWAQNNKDRYSINIEPKYSAVLQLNNNILDTRQKYRKDKKKILKKLHLRNDIKFDYIIQDEEIIKIYNEIVPITINNKKEIELTLTKILSSIRNENGKIYALRDKNSNELLATQITLEDDLEIHYVFGGSTVKERNNSLQVLLLDHIHEIKSELNKEIVVDFNGANSLNGFEDKIGYGTLPKMYFDLTLNQMEKNEK